MKANILKINGIDIYTKTGYKEFCKKVFKKKSEKKDLIIFLNKIGSIKVFKKNNNEEVIISVDFGEKICLEVSKIDYIELFEENKEVFSKKYLENNNEYYIKP